MNTFIDIISVETVKDSEGFSKPLTPLLRLFVPIRKIVTEMKNGPIEQPSLKPPHCFAFVRYRYSVSTKMVIACSDGRYEITSVEDVKGKGMYIEVLAKKVVASSG